jgi:uncharacterized membrane protein YkvA (DUF1232 family)
MLYEDLNTICENIQKLDVQADSMKLVDHAMQMWPDPQNSRDALLKLCEQLLLPVMKTVPDVVRGLRGMVDDPGTPPALRTTILLSLAYLVQANDAIQDDAPGGYGYLDDVVVLYTILGEAIRVQNMSEKEWNSCISAAGAMLIMLPPAKRDEVVGIAKQIAGVFRLMEQMPAEILAIADQAIIESPMSAAAPTLPGLNPALMYTPPTQSAHVTMHPGGGSTYSEPGMTSFSFAGGGGATLVGNDIVVW